MVYYTRLTSITGRLLQNSRRRQDPRPQIEFSKLKWHESIRSVSDIHPELVCPSDDGVCILLDPFGFFQREGRDSLTQRTIDDVLDLSVPRLFTSGSALARAERSSADMQVEEEL